MRKTINIVIVFAIISLIIFFGSGLLKKLLAPAPTYNQTTVIYKSEDINKNEKIDQTDADIVNKQSNCKKTEPCWNKVIGKTLNGDNPIYTFDLDLNSDGIINQIDVAQVESNSK